MHTAAPNDAIEVHRPPREKGERARADRTFVRYCYSVGSTHPAEREYKRISRCSSGKKASFLPSSLFLSSSLLHLPSPSSFRPVSLLGFRVNERATTFFTNSLQPHYSNSPGRLGTPSRTTIRCPTEKPASHGTGFRCTRV